MKTTEKALMRARESEYLSVVGALDALDAAPSMQAWIATAPPTINLRTLRQSIVESFKPGKWLWNVGTGGGGLCTRLGAIFVPREAELSARDREQLHRLCRIGAAMAFRFPEIVAESTAHPGWFGRTDHAFGWLGWMLILARMPSTRRDFLTRGEAEDKWYDLDGAPGIALNIRDDDATGQAYGLAGPILTNHPGGVLNALQDASRLSGRWRTLLEGQDLSRVAAARVARVLIVHDFKEASRMAAEYLRGLDEAARGDTGDGDETPAASAAAGVVSPDPFPLDETDLGILAGIHARGTLTRVTDLAGLDGMPNEDTLYKRLRAMERAPQPLVERPNGERKGYRLTAHGRSRLLAATRE